VRAGSVCFAFFLWHPIKSFLCADGLPTAIPLHEYVGKPDFDGPSMACAGNGVQASDDAGIIGHADVEVTQSFGLNARRGTPGNHVGFGSQLAPIRCVEKIIGEYLL
jgi:hypothetical protein